MVQLENLPKRLNGNDVGSDFELLHQDSLWPKRTFIKSGSPIIPTCHVQLLDYFRWTIILKNSTYLVKICDTLCNYYLIIVTTTTQFFSSISVLVYYFIILKNAK